MILHDEIGIAPESQSTEALRVWRTRLALWEDLVRPARYLDTSKSDGISSNAAEADFDLFLPPYASEGGRSCEKKSAGHCFDCSRFFAFLPTSPGRQNVHFTSPCPLAH
jgi:hypothetical protein